MRRFRNYLVCAPDEITIVTDHQPLCSIFNGKKLGSIRTERIKLRHQDIRLNVSYQKGKLNQSDFMSRHAKPIEGLPNEEKIEIDDLNNLLYMLHTTPFIHKITLAMIAKETTNDETLQTIKDYVTKGKRWIPMSDSKKVKKFKSIIQELSITGNGILIKGDRIILPDSLQSTALELAHRGAHPGQNGMTRRLR